jgi:hypothetical protein
MLPYKLTEVGDKFAVGTREVVVRHFLLKLLWLALVRHAQEEIQQNKHSTLSGTGALRMHHVRLCLSYLQADAVGVEAS